MATLKQTFRNATHPLRLLLSMAWSKAAFLVARLSLAALKSLPVWVRDCASSSRSAASCFTRSVTSLAVSSIFLSASLSASCTRQFQACHAIHMHSVACIANTYGHNSTDVRPWSLTCIYCSAGSQRLTLHWGR